VALCGAIERRDLAEDPRFLRNADRVANRQVLEAILADVFATRPAEEWTERLLAVGVPSGPVNSIADVFADPQVLARDMLIELQHPTIGLMRQSGFPFKFSATPAEPRHHPPLLGEQTEEVLRDVVGLGPDDIAALREAGAI
jgi:crotonobetainyl-CoA:carnitine CoA-transferase CaiB-like acyl-CoA transferase